MTIENTTNDLFRKCLTVEKWTPVRQSVANVFGAYSSRAFSALQVMTIAKAAEGLSSANDDDIKDALVFFVKNKVLRSRKNDNGIRLYEVNY